MGIAFARAQTVRVGVFNWFASLWHSITQFTQFMFTTDYLRFNYPNCACTLANVFPFYKLIGDFILRVTKN